MDEDEHDDEDDLAGLYRPMVWVMSLAIVLVGIASLLTYLGMP